ncbi:MAG: hypothetical protein CW335_00880 [Clostridiales bacterium]|nr:hypothetical protein [Clostridiales bacterium]
MKYLKEKSNAAERLNWYIICESVLCGIIVLSIILGQNAFTSFLLILSFVVILMHFGKLLLHGFTRIMIFCIYLMIISLVMVCISTLKFEAVFSFYYLKEYIIFASAIVYLCIASEEKINRRTTGFLLKSDLIVGCIYPIAYFTLPDPSTTVGLQMNFTNTNLTGMWILQSVLLAFICFPVLKGGWRFLAAATGIFNIYLVYLTNARNAYVAFALFLVLYLWNLLKKKPRYSKAFVAVLVLLPLIFVPLYFWLIYPISEKGWLDFLVSEGKPLSSRMKIWSRVFDCLNMKNSWVSGNYPYLHGNMHNLYMVVLGSYGSLTLGGVIAYLIYITVEVNKKSDGAFNRLCLATFFAGLFLGIGEGAFFSGGVGLNLAITSFLLMANGDACEPMLGCRKHEPKKSKYILK